MSSRQLGLQLHPKKVECSPRLSYDGTVKSALELLYNCVLSFIARPFRNYGSIGCSGTFLFRDSLKRPRADSSSCILDTFHRSFCAATIPFSLEPYYNALDSSSNLALYRKSSNLISEKNVLFDSMINSHLHEHMVYAERDWSWNAVVDSLLPFERDRCHMRFKKKKAQGAQV